MSRDGGFLFYRCRRCHAVFHGAHAPDILDATISIRAGVQPKCGGVPVYMTDLHATCIVGGVEGLGIGDFVGAATDAEIEKGKAQQAATPPWRPGMPLCDCGVIILTVSPLAPDRAHEPWCAIRQAFRSEMEKAWASAEAQLRAEGLDAAQLADAAGENIDAAMSLEARVAFWRNRFTELRATLDSTERALGRAERAKTLADHPCSCVALNRDLGIYSSGDQIRARRRELSLGIVSDTLSVDMDCPKCGGTGVPGNT